MAPCLRRAYYLLLPVTFSESEGILHKIASSCSELIGVARLCLVATGSKRSSNLGISSILCGESSRCATENRTNCRLYSNHETSNQLHRKQGTPLSAQSTAALEVTVRPHHARSSKSGVNGPSTIFTKLRSSLESALSITFRLARRLSKG